MNSNLRYEPKHDIIIRFITDVNRHSRNPLPILLVSMSIHRAKGRAVTESYDCSGDAHAKAYPMAFPVLWPFGRRIEERARDGAHVPDCGVCAHSDCALGLIAEVVGGPCVGWGVGAVDTGDCDA